MDKNLLALIECSAFIERMAKVKLYIQVAPNLYASATELHNAGIAQMVEHIFGKDEDMGSSPIASLKL